MVDGVRTYAGRRSVRLGDVDASGRVRLDAVARYLQDVATDDAADVGLAEGWVLRRLRLRVTEFPVFRDVVDLLTWCSGLAASSAERRTTLTVNGRAALDAEALWVFVDRSGRPVRLDRDRFAVYGIPTGRRLSTRLLHADPAEDPTAERRPWPLRAADVDVWGHVNNAVSLVALEDLVAAVGSTEAPRPWWVEVEYHAPIEPDDRPELVWVVRDGRGVDGALSCDGVVRTTFRVDGSAAHLEFRP